MVKILDTGDVQLSIEQIGLASQKSRPSFWDKQSAGGIWPDLLNRIDIPNNPPVGFAQKSHPGFWDKQSAGRIFAKSA